MSRRKRDTKYWIVLICVIAVFALLIGSLGGFGNVVTNLKDTLGNGTEDTSDTSTDNGTGSTDTSGGNVTEPSDTSKPSTDTALYYLGAGGGVKVITEPITSTEGYVLFAFDNVHDANTRWFTTWSIDERFTSNTCCTFIPFDYGGVTLYDVDECLDYTSGASANEFETVVSCTISDIPYKHTIHQFSGVEYGDTYALRMFKYTLSNGKTTVDVIAEIVQYIEYLNFSNFGFTQINNSGYIDYSGSPVTPETPETESLFSFTLLGYIPTDGLTVRYQTIENGEIVERTATVNTTTDIHVVGNSNIYITFPVEGILSERVSGVEEITYTSTEAVYRVSDKIAYVYFKYVSSEPSEPETPEPETPEPETPEPETPEPETPEPEIPPETPDPDTPPDDSGETYTIYSVGFEGDFPPEGITVRYQTFENGNKFENSINIRSSTHIDVVAFTDIYITIPVDDLCTVSAKDGVSVVSYSATSSVFNVISNNAKLTVSTISTLTINNLLKSQEGYISNYSIGYYTIKNGEIVHVVEENISLDQAVFMVVQNKEVSISYLDLANENNSEELVAAVNGVGCDIIPIETYAHVFAKEAVSSFDIYYWQS